MLPEVPAARRLVLRGFPAFLFIWAGQSVSLVGSSLTGFALGVWVYQRSGSLLDFAAAGPRTAVP